MTQQLTRFDTNSLNRALIGFDKFFDTFETRFANQINSTYPPYNIVKHDEDSYELQIAVTGFDKDEISVEIDQQNLIVRGTHSQSQSDEDPIFLVRGLATRNFTRMWQLGEHMEVNEGRIKNGILSIGLKRIIPESFKPRLLKITAE
jgi:molecular chaperone IbpA